MTVERFIAVYDKVDDALLDDIKVGLSTAELVDILGIDKDDDPDAYKTYQLTEPQFTKLKALLPALADVDFDAVHMHLECFSIE
jgi:hypothetical protein